MNLTLEQALIENLTTTENCILLIDDFYKNGKLNKAEIVSTIGVVGRHSNHIIEDFITHDAGFHNSYEQAKYEAEKAIKLAVHNGLPITVHRPSMVIGNSKTGRVKNFQVFYHLIEFLSGAKSFGFLPNFYDYQLDLIPVDYVAESILHSSISSDTIGKVMHLSSGLQAANLKELSKFLNQSSKNHQKIKFIPNKMFHTLLKCIYTISDSKTKKAIKKLPWFLTYLKEKQTFTNNQTIQINQQNDIHLPYWKDYISAILKYYQRNCSRPS